MDTFIKGAKGHREGNINDNTKYIVRIDGNIEKDAELMIRDSNELEKAAPKLLEACKQAARVLEEHSQYDDDSDGEPSAETEAMKACLEAIAEAE